MAKDSGEAGVPHPRGQSLKDPKKIKAASDRLHAGDASSQHALEGRQAARNAAAAAGAPGETSLSQKRPSALQTYL